MQAIQFKNFSDQAFTWKYDGIAYTFEAGQTIFLEDYKAEHFAKHLVDRELTKKNIVTDNKVERAKMLSLCFPASEPVAPEVALDIEEKKKVSKKKSKKEAEFEELNDE